MCESILKVLSIFTCFSNIAYETLLCTGFVWNKKETFLFKVARVVDLKLVFTEWFFYNLVILIKLCKIWYLNLDKALLFLRNQVICLKNWKLWQAPTTIKFNIFCWDFARVSYLTMSTKGCLGFFYFV